MIQYNHPSSPSLFLSYYAEFKDDAIAKRGSDDRVRDVIQIDIISIKKIIYSEMNDDGLDDPQHCDVDHCIYLEALVKHAGAVHCSNNRKECTIVLEFKEDRQIHEFLNIIEKYKYVSLCFSPRKEHLKEIHQYARLQVRF